MAKTRVLLSTFLGFWLFSSSGLSQSYCSLRVLTGLKFNLIPQEGNSLTLEVRFPQKRRTLKKILRYPANPNLMDRLVTLKEGAGAQSCSLTLSQTGIVRAAYLKTLVRFPSAEEFNFWTQRPNSIWRAPNVANISSWLQFTQTGRTSLLPVLKQPSINTSQTDILKKYWWEDLMSQRPRPTVGYFFVPDNPTQPAPDKIFWLSINNPAVGFNPPFVRESEKRFQTDISSKTGFKPNQPLFSQFTLDHSFQDDSGVLPENSIQIEGDTIGMLLSSRGFLPTCEMTQGKCKNSGNFVMAANYNFDYSPNPARPVPWKDHQSLLVTVDAKVPFSRHTNALNAEGHWKSAVFLNANFLMVDKTSGRKFWYSISLFDGRGRLGEFIHWDSCPNGLCLNIPIVFSSLAADTFTNTRALYSQTLPDSHFFPKQAWDDRYRTLSFLIRPHHVQKALNDVNQKYSYLTSNPSDLEIEHFNLSPELHRGDEDNAAIGVSFKNLRIYSIAH